MQKMRVSVSILAVASAIVGCTSYGARDRAGAQAPDRHEPVALARTFVIDEARPVRTGAAPAANDDDPLSLKATPLHADFGIGDAQFRGDQAAALNGDKDAALRVAYMFQNGSNGVPRDERRMVQWLHRASDLSSGTASYELYRFYLGRGLDRAALRYEKRALEQGFVPPPRLDPRRG